MFPINRTFPIERIFLINRTFPIDRIFPIDRTFPNDRIFPKDRMFPTDRIFVFISFSEIIKTQNSNNLIAYCLDPQWPSGPLRSNHHTTY